MRRRSINLDWRQPRDCTTAISGQHDCQPRVSHGGEGFPATKAAQPARRKAQAGHEPQP